MGRWGILILFGCCRWAATQELPQALLDRALRFSDKYNWVDAKDPFASAEEGFRAAGDPRNMLYARIGRLQSTMERILIDATSSAFA
jgi:hypothetical protein